MRSKSLKLVGGTCILFLSFIELMLVSPYFRKRQRAFFSLMRKEVSDKRSLSIYLGNGQCIWTHAHAIADNYAGKNLLLASYPGGGMRLTWQHAQGLTEIQVHDDFMLAPGNVKKGIVKTQYPHLEGIWSWGRSMDNVVLVMQNPRWSIPSYNNLLYEIHYAHDWETAYLYKDRLFTLRPPIEDWIRWRDYRFIEEVFLWQEFIHFWMLGGRQYWMDWDFERNGQWPFRWLNSTEYKTDFHCLYDIDCNPLGVLSYEKLRANATGPAEANKLAQIIENELQGLPIIHEDGRECIWHEVENHKPLPDKTDRTDLTGLGVDIYNFTYGQLKYLQNAVVEVRDFYNSGTWTSNNVAQDLVGLCQEYVDEMQAEIDELESVGLAPTAAPNREYQKYLREWYIGLGRGDRYNKAKVQAENSYIWEEIKHLYEESVTTAPTVPTAAP